MPQGQPRVTRVGGTYFLIFHENQIFCREQKANFSCLSLEETIYLKLFFSLSFLSIEVVFHLRLSSNEGVFH